jgi:ribosome biogenesis protein Tsr3
MKINKDIISAYILISNFMKINQDIMSTYILISNFMKINQDIMSTYILISNFMKINKDIISTYILISNFMKIKFLKVDGRDPQNREKLFLLGGDRVGGKGVCGRLMSPAQETPAQRGRVNRYEISMENMRSINPDFRQMYTSRKLN